MASCCSRFAKHPQPGTYIRCSHPLGPSSHDCVPPAGNGDSVYSRLMEAIGKPDMTSANPLYANNAARCERVDEIMGTLCASKEVPVEALSVQASVCVCASALSLHSLGCLKVPGPLCSGHIICVAHGSKIMSQTRHMLLCPHACTHPQAPSRRTAPHAPWTRWWKL